MTCTLKPKVGTYKKNGVIRSYDQLSPMMMRELDKNPCCEHVAQLLQEIKNLIIEREDWHTKYHAEKYGVSYDKP